MTEVQIVGSSWYRDTQVTFFYIYKKVLPPKQENGLTFEEFIDLVGDP